MNKTQRSVYPADQAGFVRSGSSSGSRSFRTLTEIAAVLRNELDEASGERASVTARNGAGWLSCLNESSGAAAVELKYRLAVQRLRRLCGQGDDPCGFCAGGGWGDFPCAGFSSSACGGESTGSPSRWTCNAGLRRGFCWVDPGGDYSLRLSAGRGPAPTKLLREGDIPKLQGWLFEIYQKSFL